MLRVCMLSTVVCPLRIKCVCDIARRLVKRRNRADLPIIEYLFVNETSYEGMAERRRERDGWQGEKTYNAISTISWGFTVLVSDELLDFTVYAMVVPRTYAVKNTVAWLKFKKNWWKSGQLSIVKFSIDKRCLKTLWFLAPTHWPIPIANHHQDSVPQRT